jgi:ABC-type arginine transport system ATPase subunit
MLTKITIRNFKSLSSVEIPLDQNVVLIGPNNAGKTSALQALTLWELGIRTWFDKRGLEDKSSQRAGVAINRRDLIALPVPDSKLLWNDLHVRKNSKQTGKQVTSNILIEVIVEGVSAERSWKCGLGFDYANTESLYVKPLKKADGDEGWLMEPSPSIINEIVQATRVALLPPMSGLASIEPKWEAGRINVLIGEGQTAQVLRNLCLEVSSRPDAWEALSNTIQRLFGVSIQRPEFLEGRGEVVMTYRTPNDIDLDISSAGRGLQQTLLILGYIYARPKTIVMLDEPDAHLEILRQRQIYQTITEIAKRQESQLICASHSEVVLDEAIEKDTVVAFVGRPHVISDKQQLMKSLREIGFQDYLLAEERGWVLYLEGSTDLSILQGFARKLNHPALDVLASPFAKFLGNNIPRDAEKHFYALKEAYPSLVGCAVFDRVQSQLNSTEALQETQWSKREIENYLCFPYVLEAYIRGFSEAPDLFAEDRVETLKAEITKITDALKVLKKPAPWGPDIKTTDDFLDPVFENYSQARGLPQSYFKKKSYHELVEFLRPDDIDPEVVEKLNLIYQTSQKAKPYV